MNDFASESDSEYTNYWRDWVSAIDIPFPLASVRIEKPPDNQEAPAGRIMLQSLTMGSTATFLLLDYPPTSIISRKAYKYRQSHVSIFTNNGS